jgi:hypothetical protein
MQGTYTQLMSMPGERCEVSAIVVGARLYVVGGGRSAFTNRPGIPGVALQRVEYYDPAEDAWHACAPLPQPRDRWAEVSPMKHKRGSAGAALIDARIHVVGGRGLEPDVTITAARRL